MTAILGPGALRQRARLTAKTGDLAAFYLNTPALPPSRQVDRRAKRKGAKAAKRQEVRAARLAFVKAKRSARQEARAAHPRPPRKPKPAARTPEIHLHAHARRRFAEAIAKEAA